MPLGDVFPQITVPGRRMDNLGWESWLNPNQQPTIPQGPSTYGIPGTMGGGVFPGQAETFTMGAYRPRGGGSQNLVMPTSPVPSLNQIIAEATKPKTITKGLGVESLLQNQVLGRILNSYYGDQAWKDLENPYVDVAATPDFRTFEGGGGAYGYIDPMFGRLLPSLSTKPEMQDIELEKVAGGKNTDDTPAPSGPDTSGLPEIPFELEPVPTDQERPPVPYPAPQGYRWFWTPYGWILEEDI